MSIKNYNTDSKSIVIAVHHFPPNFKGGAEWRAHRTAKWLQAQGHTVQVICVESISDSTTSNLRWVDDLFDGLSVRRLYLNLNNAPNPARWEYDNPWIKDHLIEFLSQLKPDVFHLISGYLMTAGAIDAAKSLDIPVVATLTDFWFLCPRHTLRRTSGDICAANTALDCARCKFEEKRRFRLPAQKAPQVANLLWRGMRAAPAIADYAAEMTRRATALKTALAAVDVAICPSEFLLNTYRNRGFSAQQMRFIRQGLQHIPEWPLQKRQSDKIRVGYIGQLAPHKGVHVLVDAFCRLSEDTSTGAKLTLYGDSTHFPKYAAQLQAMAGSRPDIHFPGPFDNAQVSQVYQNLDVLVVPSVWYENSPNTILEAFAHQTPVIATNLGGMAELVDHQKTGLLFAPGNADDLADKLSTALANPALLAEWQQNIQPPKSLPQEMEELGMVYRKLGEGVAAYVG